MEKLKLGIIGLSEGNGHPYSWSAIFNGYNPEYMKDCGFPVISEYLSKKRFPEDCIQNANVTHIWTQDKKISELVCKASNIPNISDKPDEMIGKIDAVLLARDDSKKHFEMAKPFIDAGFPIYIDKPLATTLEEANKIYALEKYEGQIFTCSALGYEPHLTDNQKDIGEIRYIDAHMIKDWEKYSIHIIEPSLRQFDYTQNIVNVTVNDFKNCKSVVVNWENGLTTSFKTLHDAYCGASVCVYGTKGKKEFNFPDTFITFKSALTQFIDILQKKKKNDSKAITLKAIEIVERGNNG